ncbi:MAG: cytochrome c [Gemmatimonadales bacterium]|nr:MAG: cytochrome c [Gemmatimonadales bacterium]
MADPREAKVKLRTWIMGFLVAMTAAGCTPMDDLIVAIFGRSMRDTESIKPYQNPQDPPEGSISFASGNFPTSPGEVNFGQPEGTPIPARITPLMVAQATGNPEDFPDVTALENPVPADEASLERGGELYHRACVPCHGEAGGGGGPVTGAGVAAISILEDNVIEYTDGYLYSIIRVGRGAMPGYAHQLTHYDRWHVVNYVRQLQGDLPQQADEDDDGDESNGQEN